MKTANWKAKWFVIFTRNVLLELIQSDTFQIFCTNIWYTTVWCDAQKFLRNVLKPRNNQTSDWPLDHSSKRWRTTLKLPSIQTHSYPVLLVFRLTQLFSSFKPLTNLESYLGDFSMQKKFFHFKTSWNFKGHSKKFSSISCANQQK